MSTQPQKNWQETVASRRAASELTEERQDDFIRSLLRVALDDPSEEEIKRQVANMTKEDKDHVSSLVKGALETIFGTKGQTHG